MTGIILLAAGSSSRFGSPKQNLEFQGQTLLQRAIHTAVEAVLGPVVVVLGANQEAILPHLPEGMAVHLTFNPDWEYGMASSIKAGLAELQKLAPNISGAIVMLCDQPFVSAALLQNLLETQQESGKEIVACSYKDTLGAPVYFSHTYFPEISRLQGQEGAKKIILHNPSALAVVSFELGSIDIDTPQDYASFKGLS